MIAILLLSAPPSHLGGLVSRSMLEIDSNCFMGQLSVKTADFLWEAVSSTIAEGYGTLIKVHSRKGERYEILTCGKHPRQVSDFDGMQLLSFISSTTLSNVRAIPKCENSNFD